MFYNLVLKSFTVKAHANHDGILCKIVTLFCVINLLFMYI